MKHKALILAISALSSSIFAANNQELQQEIQRLQDQTKQLQSQLDRLQKQLVAQAVIKPTAKPAGKRVMSKPATPAAKHAEVKSTAKNIPIAAHVAEKNAVTTKNGKAEAANPAEKEPAKTFHTSMLAVHTADKDHKARGFYPTALIAEGRVISYIAGTPVVSSPYLGERPAFDGSDYIVNISSINRDIRLMEQRRRLYRAYESIGYPKPNMPIIAISGKAEPVGVIDNPYVGRYAADLNLGSSELDVAAALNDKVEAFISMSYDETPPPVGQRVSNSVFSLNMGFVNIGNLDRSPLYFTAGQMFVPFGRYSSSMISSTLPQRLARTKSRPFILGYKSQGDCGPYAAIYGFKSDTSLGHSGIGGVNLGYILSAGELSGDLGIGYISSLTDSAGMQDNGSQPFTTFGGFASDTNGSELVRKIPGVNVHGNISFDRYSLTAEWVGASRRFRYQDLSFNYRGAKPQAAQVEGAVTFMAFRKPASLALGYQWSKETLALHLPKHRLNAVFNISIWKDTVESLEYRRDVDFNAYQFANGIAPPRLFNLSTFGTGRVSDALIAQIGVYF